MVKMENTEKHFLRMVVGYIMRDRNDNDITEDHGTRDINMV
jgi:hypothetical protein